MKAIMGHVQVLDFLLLLDYTFLFLLDYTLLISLWITHGYYGILTFIMNYTH